MTLLFFRFHSNPSQGSQQGLLKGVQSYEFVYPFQEVVCTTALPWVPAGSIIHVGITAEKKRKNKQKIPIAAV